MFENLKPLEYTFLRKIVVNGVLSLDSLCCPSCHSVRLYRDGFRILCSGSQVQRYLCRDCGRRFSERQQLQETSERHLSKSDSLFLINQVGADKGAKNLNPTTEIKTVAGEKAQLEISGAFAVFTAKQITQGLKDKTIENNLKSLKDLQKRGANLLEPESSFLVIREAKKYGYPRSEKTLTEEDWSAGTKNVVARAYLKFCKLLKIPIPEHVNFAKFKQIAKIPYVPFEKDINILIHACSRKIAVFLQTLKESGARCGEIYKLKWKDIDLERKYFNINEPEKGSLPRQIKISDKLVAMLKTLPTQGEKVWGTATLHQIRSNFNNQRNRAAFKLCNPRLKEIHFHSFRHFFATMEYHKSKDILRVKAKLGHKSINSTMIYTHLIDFEVEEYTSRIAKNIEEAQKLVDVGFEFVCDYSEEGKLFRKRK